jgi:transcriptional regulator with XRE-family HTH domain
MARPTQQPKADVSVALARMREFLHLTQDDLAKRLRVTTVTVARWETSHPPRGKTLERLLRFAQRNGPAVSADMFLRAITREKSEEYRRYRTAQILDAGNVQDLRVLLRELFEFERDSGQLDPLHDARKWNYFMMLADRLCLGGRKEFLGAVGEDE